MVAVIPGYRSFLESVGIENSYLGITREFSGDTNLLKRLKYQIVIRDLASRVRSLFIHINDGLSACEDNSVIISGSAYPYSRAVAC